ncbi:RNA polymerase factor sigma-54 [Paenibacillus pasadenensis]|uniref:RNA polymerase factor sigma-54 n=1 Tax=Paenibacillus pasadenensis TaxID=217090 RepID=UPI0020414630|nr:RNA polymerase factor sigma-54 [Paenibacillus pasadenensis]MCM3747760.1 RNA polymerase factor sigma-54 [Paenibacillus pasadenensis]
MNVPALVQQGALRQEQRQRLALTVQMRQSLALLALPVTQLEERVRELAADNPLLEVRSAPALSGLGRRSAAGFRSAPDPLQKAASAPPSLEGELLGQLGQLRLPMKLRQAAAYLAGNLDESGYLELSLEEAAVQLGIGAELAEDALKLLQSLEPAGIGARDLRECLLLQLDRQRQGAHVPQSANRAEQQRSEELVASLDIRHMAQVRELADRWLPQLAARRWEEIAAGTGIGRTELEEAARQLRRLNPRPGLSLGEARAETLIADARVGLTADGELQVELNAAWEPRLLVTESTAGLFAGIGKQHEAYAYAVSCRRSARLLLDSLSLRRQTLEKVVRTIFNEQQPFLAEGWPALRPLTMADVAMTLGVHESTVSRAVAHKYVQTPYGTYGLKSFFSATLGRDSGEAVSAAAAKQRLAVLVAAESGGRPLSDRELAARLAQDGVPLSRRTVAKYREELHIPCSSLRRR